jgi:hypothetical protein
LRTTELMSVVPPMIPVTETRTTSGMRNSSTAAALPWFGAVGVPPKHPRKMGNKKSPGSGLFSTPSCPGSIVGAEAFHFRVRDGNGWCHLALATESFFYSIGSGGRTRTYDLRVMSPASCRCSTPRRVMLRSE